MLYIRNPLHLATMLRSILDNLHGRVNRLEKEYMVNVDMENKKFDIEHNTLIKGFVASALAIIINANTLVFYNVVAISPNIDLEFFNDKLNQDLGTDLEKNNEFRQFLTGFFPEVYFDNEKITLQTVTDNFLLPVQMEQFDILAKVPSFHLYRTHEYEFGFLWYQLQ